MLIVCFEVYNIVWIWVFAVRMFVQTIVNLKNCICLITFFPNGLWLYIQLLLWLLLLCFLFANENTSTEWKKEKKKQQHQYFIVAIVDRHVFLVICSLLLSLSFRVGLRLDLCCYSIQFSYEFRFNSFCFVLRVFQKKSSITINSVCCSNIYTLDKWFSQ